ncbi:hypothetical protein [Pseudomonas zeae]|uniref:Uncharacterized protein n=1 Tax=Pseudomonas zeae TaxID=2745510 RepID=A0ABU5BK02_9PSED|nr:hypothetical protein [Pseudomonas zeae]MDX9677011.1 hypothetical protein [Pseudomonas zeae]
MANRSKKVVLSTRIAPYLKSGLELCARARNMKIVETIEELIEHALMTNSIDSPFPDKNGVRGKASVLSVVEWLWNDDPIIYTLRLGFISDQLVDRETYVVCAETTTARFKGDFDLFEEPRKRATYQDVYKTTALNIEKIREEWEDLCAYAKFVEANKPLKIDYEDFLRMAKG